MGNLLFSNYKHKVLLTRKWIMPLPRIQLQPGASAHLWSVCVSDWPQRAREVMQPIQMPRRRKILRIEKLEALKIKILKDANIYNTKILWA